MLIMAPFAMCEEKYSVLIIPDNIVTESAAIDSYIYDAAAEFFANEVINILELKNETYEINVKEKLALKNLEFLPF